MAKLSCTSVITVSMLLMAGTGYAAPLPSAEASKSVQALVNSALAFTAPPPMTKADSRAAVKSLLMAKALSVTCPFKEINQEAVDFMAESLSSRLTLAEPEVVEVGNEVKKAVIDLLMTGKEEACAKYESDFEERARTGLLK